MKKIPAICRVRCVAIFPPARSGFGPCIGLGCLEFRSSRNAAPVPPWSACIRCLAGALSGSGYGNQWPNLKFIKFKSTASGGDGEIRTLGTELSVRRFSKPLVSATHPRLRIAAERAGYSEGLRGRQGGVGAKSSDPAATRLAAKPTRLIAGSLPRCEASILVRAETGPERQE